MTDTKKPQISILMFLFSFSNLMGLMYSAALPDLSLYFKVDKELAQQTLILFLVGFSIGQLIYGPLSSAIGRKKAILSGCSLAVFGSLVCIWAISIVSFPLILIGRILTALGSACSLGMTLTLLNDVFNQTEAKKKLSILLGGFAFFPAIGIYIGGAITQYLSWKECFYFMLFYSIFMLIICSFLPETLKEKSIGHLHPLRVLKIYFSHFKYTVFLFCSFILGIGGGVIYIFAAEAPFIAINQLKMSPDLFGLLNLIPFFGLFLGGFFSRYFTEKLTPLTLILLGSIIYFAASVFMLICFQSGLVNKNTLFLFPLLIFFSFPMIFSSTSLLGISSSPDKSYAASLINCIQIMIAVLIMETITLFPAKNPVALPLIYSIIGIILLILWSILRILPTNEKGK